MSNVGYIFKVARRINFGRMLEKSADISKKTGKSKIITLADMVYCGFSYGAGYMDYYLFEMYNMNRYQRSTVLTRGKNNRYVALLNHPDSFTIFENKTNFLSTFSEYVHRAWIDLNSSSLEEFKRFALELGSFVAKPPDGTHGDSVELITVDQDTDLSELHIRLMKNKQTLCEEVIKQHPELSAVYGHAVNTIRAVTMVKNNKVFLATALLRIGNGGRVVDNFNNGGMVTPIDVDTGIVTSPAQDKSGNTYANHPYTGTQIEGIHIPFWQECLSLVKSAATVVPDVRYVGWDVAITPNGPLIIEGNHFPGHDIYHLPAQTPDKIGVLPSFEAIIPLKSLKKK